MKKYMFYDTTWNQILRVGNMVSKHMKSDYMVKTYGVVYETAEKPTDPTATPNYFDEQFVSTDIKKINDYINHIKPDVVIFAQNTIPDLDALLVAKKFGAQIVMMQHGLLYDGASLNNVRIGEVFAALMKIKKTLGYLNIVRIMCRLGKKSYIKMLVDIIVKKYNVTTTIQNSFSPALRGDIAFVIGEHWVNYYHDNYGYDKENIYVMGNHDVDDLKIDPVLEDAICYIPSVHVEDGHVTQYVFENFLKALSDSVPRDTKLYVKFHPRSNKELYYKFFENKNVEYISGPELPYVRTYIGHNSSLLSKALQISGVLILWGFKEEKELFYKDFAYAVCGSDLELKEAIDYVLKNKEYSKKAEIGKYSHQNPMGAYKYCAQKIIDKYGEE
jgi:hypothetical protein